MHPLQVIHRIEEVGVRSIAPQIPCLLEIGRGLFIAIRAINTRGVGGVEQAIDIASAALADKICVVRWWANTNRLGGTTKKIAEIVGLERSVLVMFTKLWGLVYQHTNVCNWLDLKSFLS